MIDELGTGDATAAALYCDRCGNPLSEGTHTACHSARTLEPPRYCGLCRRRMVVQIVPTGWRARCSEHGERTESC